MKTTDKMNPLEWRASMGLASIFGLRMLGMFIILPVFALYAGHLPGGEDKTLVGIALGAYGLTQALLQIPLGWLSDRIGRKPVIAGGLVVFALGSFVAASANSIDGIILGRIIQGAGAISAAIIALTADLTREEYRTKAMALIGVTIGLTFSASMILAPVLYPHIGIPGIFVMTGVLALLAIGVSQWVVPNPPHPPQRAPRAPFSQVLRHAELLRLNWGIFVLHASLMATFVVVPQSLVQAGLHQSDHWKLYLPVMVGSFILMIPGVALSHGKWRKTVFLASVAILLAAQTILFKGMGSVRGIAAGLTVFFVAFNVLEASLPSLVTVVTPPGTKGTATGIYSSIQFLGAFCGGALAGFLSKHWGPDAVPVFCAGLTTLWLVVAWPMQIKKAS
ncbi:MAG: MFS transporter [Betaproteobacteria bacterium]|nr:MFS transporter [Betaproteobacteria bacterium]